MKLNNALLATVLALVITPALAHTGVTVTSGFAAGFLHPIGGADHVLAMVAVGMLGAVIGGRALWAVPASFVGAMIIGGALGFAGIALPFVEPAILLSIVVFGAAVANARPLPVGAACVLVALFALFHGHAHGTEAPATVSGVSYAIGFALATALMHIAGIGAALAATRALGTATGRITVRAAGAATALAGLALIVG